MHLKYLKVFCDVVSRRSFSRAAEENGITQPGASQMVHQLEDHLGVKLIDRSKRPLVMTAEGEVYYDGCRKLVQKFYSLEDQVRAMRDEVAGRVSVASIFSVGLSYMHDFVKRFKDLHPKATVNLEYHHPDRVYEMVDSGQADFGLVSFPKKSRNIKAISWREEPMVLVCSPDHPLASRQQIQYADLSGLDMVGFDTNLVIRRRIDKALAACGIDVHVVMEFDNIETLKRAIELNTGISLLPRPTIAHEIETGSLICKDVDNFTLVRPLGIIKRSGDELGTTARRFMELLLQQSSTESGDNNGHAANVHDARDRNEKTNTNHAVDETQPTAST